MLNISEDGRAVTVAEPCGIEHRKQVITIPLPPGDFFLEEDNGAKLPLQRSKQLPETGFAAIGLGAFQVRRFTLRAGRCEEGAPVEVRVAGEYFELGNGKVAIRIPRGGTGGPIAAIRHNGGAFFGTSYFDTLTPLERSECRLVENGPLRAQVEFRIGTRYRALLTLDVGEDFCGVDEEFDTFEGDQLVWEFGGDSLPRTGYFLNSTPCFETRSLGYQIDRELARLGCWSQQSQMNLCDGFAFRHPAENTVWGAVTCEGGEWRGNRGNSIDAYMRRLRNGDRATRRLVAPGAKADALPAPASEYNPVRDVGDCTPVLCWEANLGRGRRKWALVMMTREELVPPAGDDAAQIRASLELSHFEDHVSEEFCRSLQSPLRKRHIEQVIPFARLVARPFDCGEAARCNWGLTSSDDFMHELIAPGQPEQKLDSGDFLRKVEAYIEARIISFWYGAGIASTNPVSSRRIAPYQFLTEELAAGGVLGGERLERLRKRFLFLAMLNNDQGFYAGRSAMLPPCDEDSFDPPMKGMANQNFYTDVITVSGMAGLLLPDHPLAAKWVEDFIAMFRRQLEVHAYPNGLWEESHTYCQHVLLTVLPVVMMLRHSGRFDFFAEETFRKMLDAVTGQISVADVSSESKRGLLPFGDHDSNVRPYRVMWHAYAGEFRECAPALAAKLNFLAKESGGKFLADLPQTPPDPGNRELKGFGIIFRGRTGDQDETILALRSGCAWAHHHNDDGSIQLYYGDRMLIGDAGHSGRLSGGAKIADYGHSRWLLQGVEILNYHWRFNRGWVTASKLEGAMPYATIYTPALFELRHGQDVPLPRAIRHFRSIIKLAEKAFLVVDSTLEAVRENICFHFGSGSFEPVEHGARAMCGEFQVRIRSLNGLEVRPGMVVEGDVPERQMTSCTVLFEPRISDFFSAFLIDFGRELRDVPLPEIAFDSGFIRVGEITLEHREECL